MKKFTIPCTFDTVTAPFNIYIGEPAPGAEPLWAQLHWLLEERGGRAPDEVVDSFQKLLNIAAENNVSFEELCVYALGSQSDEADAQQEQSSPSPENAGG